MFSYSKALVETPAGSQQPLGHFHLTAVINVINYTCVHLQRQINMPAAQNSRGYEVGAVWVARHRVEQLAMWIWWIPPNNVTLEHDWVQALGGEPCFTFSLYPYILPRASSKR